MDDYTIRRSTFIGVDDDGRDQLKYRIFLTQGRSVVDIRGWDEREVENELNMRLAQNDITDVPDK